MPFSSDLDLQMFLKNKNKIESGPSETKQQGCMKRALSASLKGSVTVEAAMALSIFIMFFAMLLSIFAIMKSQIENFYAIDNAAEKIALVSITDEDISMEIGLFGNGISTEGDEVKISNTYYEHVAFVPDNIVTFRISNIVCRHKWTGRILYENEDSEEEYVFMTDNGAVYHIDENCTHLHLSISSVYKSELEKYRNNNGARYRPCEKCGGNSNMLYISPEGDCYHSDVNCSGLKRTYHRVKKSEAGVPACSRCGKEGD